MSEMIVPTMMIPGCALKLIVGNAIVFRNSKKGKI